MNNMKILWQPVKNGVRILKIYGTHPTITVPDHIKGCPVTEIGPYCFSASRREIPGEIYTFFTRSEQDAGLFALEGNIVEEIVLPDTINTLHNAAFYNCRKLHTLSTGASISGIGSDEFTNCTKLTHLIFRCQHPSAPGLSLILERIETDLNVLFAANTRENPSAADDTKNPEISGALFFPEYYEWLDEISPAHLFSRSIHGEGFRMRKSFQGHNIDYYKYDSCFENALTIESESVLCRIALNRLRWPNNLEEAFRHRYEKTVNTYFDTALSLIIKEQDYDMLLFLFTAFHPDSSAFTQAISQTIDADWGKATAALMEMTQKIHSTAKKSFDFDDF